MAVQFHITFVDQNGRSGRSVKPSQPTDMIDMRVCADDGANLQAVLPENFLDAPDFVAWVHDDCFVRYGIAQNRAIALQHSDRNDFMNQFLRHRPQYTSSVKLPADGHSPRRAPSYAIAASDSMNWLA